MPHAGPGTRRNSRFLPQAGRYKRQNLGKMPHAGPGGRAEKENLPRILLSGPPAGVLGESPDLTPDLRG
jgi:hypothetical protein